LALPNQGTWVLTFHTNGKYDCAYEGPLNLPGHSGTWEALNDQWKTESTAGTPWRDGGEYQFIDADSVLMSGKLGTATWVRRKGGGAAKPQNTGNEKRISEQVVPAGGTVTRVAPLVAAAKGLAKTWQADAALVSMVVKTEYDGRLQLKNVMTPANQYGGYVTMNFNSLTANKMQTYVLDPSGRVVAQIVMPTPGSHIAPIPEPFLDLDDAIAKARENGLKMPKAGEKSFIDARLDGIRGEFGKPNSATWTVSGWDFSGPAPTALGEPVTLAAASGSVTTWKKESGHLDREKLIDELRRGKTLARDPRRELEVYRREADAMAAKWNAELKLSEIGLQGRNPNKLEIERIEFFYYRPVPEGWSIFQVKVFGVKEGMLVQGEEVAQLLSKEEYKLQSAPEKFLTPGEALFRLAKLDPKWNEQQLMLRLIFGGSTPDDGAAGEEKAAGNDDFPEEVKKVLRSRWLWVTEGSRASRQRSGMFTYNVDGAAVFAIDAITGEPLLSPEIVAGKKPSGPEIKGVDPALVGTWKGTHLVAGQDVMVTIRFSADGEAKMNMEAAALKRDITFTVAAEKGKCTIRSPEGEVERGTYQFPDRDTLHWMEGAETLKLKRVGEVARGGTPEVPTMPTKVDRALVGVWQGTSAALGMKLTISFAASGEYILDFEEDNGKSSQSAGAVQAGGGKFSWTSPMDDSAKEPEKGTYRLSDASTLSWTPTGGGDLLPKTWKRVSATPRPRVDPRLIGTWQGTPDGKEENRVTMRISAEGGYSFAANKDQGEQRPLSDSVLAAEKKWTVKAGKKTQTGTYTIVDDTTLTWAVHGGAAVTLKRVSAKP